MANNKLFLSNLLMDMKISPRYLGYLYLQAIVSMILENQLYLKSLSRYVYLAIAKEFKTAPKSVEKAIDNALSRAYQKGGLKQFPGESCPPNKEVISYLVNCLFQNDLKMESSVSVLRFN